MSPARPAVVIPTHSRRDLLESAVESARGATILVVDDSEGGLPPIAGVQWIRTRGSQGFAQAVNIGLQAAALAGHSSALVLNDDAVLGPDCYDRLRHAWSRLGGVVGPVVRTSAGGVQSAGFRLRRWGRLTANPSVPASVTAVDAVSGACLVMGTSWRFDPAHRHGMEDIELCRRVRAAGGGVWLVPDASCVHQGGATLPAHSPEAQRHAVAGHLRLVGGGLRTLPVLMLATAQVVREGGPVQRLPAILQGLHDHRAARR